MPSDDLRPRVRAALAPRLAAFRAALASALDDVAAAGAHGGGPEGDGALAVEMGPFAEGRIDASLLEEWTRPKAPASEPARRALARAGDVLREALAAEAPSVDVPSGACLRDAVAEALARAGRAFGAARVAARVRGGRYDELLHGSWTTSLPFAHWSRSERALAPPLVVAVDGADLAAGALAEFLDGAVAIVLEVRGRCAPAPLVRLVTPGAFAAQSVDASPVEALVRGEGPGVVALVPDTAARFVHDPSAGPSLAQRLAVSHVPKEEPLAPVGGWSARQQAEDLRQLATLVAPPRPTAGADPVDRLASWLLRQAEAKG